MSFLLLSCAAVVSSPIAAQTVDLVPVADATMYEPTDDCSNPMLELTADGQGTGLYTGRTGPMAQNRARRALLRFDVAAAIPAGATIESAALSLTVNRSPNETGFTTDLLALEQSWNEGPAESGFVGGAGEPAGPGDVTWCDRELGTSAWTTAGGDFGAVVGSTLIAGTGTYVFPTSPGMVAAVQSWLDDPMANYGWLVRGSENFSDDRDSFSARRLASREDDEDGPVLTVTYSVSQPSPLEVPLGRTAGLLLVLALAWCGTRWLRSA